MAKDISVPYYIPDIGEQEIEEVVSTMRSGWITTGKKTNQFEEDFSRFLGEDLYCLAVNSATAGLHLALEALGVGSGDEVITTTHTFTATAEVIRYLGAKPIFVDIDESSLCISVKEIEKKIGSKTKAFIPVHFGGLSADIDPLLKLSKSHNIPIVEDAAHALPTTYKGQLIGTLKSEVTVFSFYANKTITTAEGGMLVTRNKYIAERVKLMRSHGINKISFDRFASKKPSWQYEVLEAGYKYNLTDISSAIGIHQLRKAERFRQGRELIANKYNQKLSHLPLILPPLAMEDDIHSWHLYVVQLKGELFKMRDEIIQRLFNHGVGCSVHYIPLHLHPYWAKKYSLTKEMFPVSQKVYERSISLPIYHKMTNDQVNFVIQKLEDIIA